MSNRLNVFKVTALPPQPVPNAIYYVRAPGASVVAVYVVSAEGQALPLAGLMTPEVSAKLDFIAVTQAVNLDQIEADAAAALSGSTSALAGLQGKQDAAPNLSLWSSVAPGTKQNAAANLTAWSSIDPSSKATMVSSPSAPLDVAITWDGTPPSGAVVDRLEFDQIGSLVLVRYRIEYSVGGTANTTCTFPFPARLPAPAMPTGVDLNEAILSVSAFAHTSPIGIPQALRAWVTQGSSASLVNHLGPSASYRLLHGAFQYRTTA